MRNRVIYLSPRKANKLREIISADWEITRRHFKDAVKFIRDYWEFRRRGKTHQEAAADARNTF